MSLSKQSAGFAAFALDALGGAPIAMNDMALANAQATRAWLSAIRDGRLVVAPPLPAPTDSPEVAGADPQSA